MNIIGGYMCAHTTKVKFIIILETNMNDRTKSESFLHISLVMYLGSLKMEPLKHLKQIFALIDFPTFSISSHPRT